MYADIDAVAENITVCISQSRFLFYFKNTEILDAVLIELILLTHYTPKVPSYRNQSIDLQNKSIDWFLYDGNFSV